MWRDLLAKIHGLKCADSEISACNADRSICERNAGKYLRFDFPVCPIRSAMEDGPLMFALSLESQMEIAPISGWPDNYAGWVVDLIGQIKEIRNQKAVDELKRAKNG